MRAEAAVHAAKVLEEAEADADLLTTEAQTRALKITAEAEQQRDDLLITIEQSRHRFESIDRRVNPSEAIDTPPESIESVVDNSEELERLTVDLREEPVPEESEWDETITTERSERPSRYKSRSANLPHLGDNATSIIGSLGNLRTKE